MMKEQEIRPLDLFVKYLELSRQDAESFFSDAFSFESIDCPGCGSDQAQLAFKKDRFEYMECKGCGSLFVSPRPPVKALLDFYIHSPSSAYWAEKFFPAVAEARREKIFIPRVQEISRLLALRSFQPLKVIDVGAGYGIFLEEFRKRFPGAAVAAVEPGRKLAEICRQKEIETLELPVEEAGSWKERADFVSCFEVIEHVHSPKEFVSSLAALMKPGGYLLVTGLGVEGFDIQILWERSKSVSPPHHLNFMSVEGFKSLFEQAGLISVEVLTPGKLDFDIVRNEWLENPSVLEGNRFLELLFKRRGEETHERFQKFLAENQLSSHVWVLAQKPFN